MNINDFYTVNVQKFSYYNNEYYALDQKTII